MPRRRRSAAGWRFGSASYRRSPPDSSPCGSGAELRPMDPIRSRAGRWLISFARTWPDFGPIVRSVAAARAGYVAHAARIGRRSPRAGLAAAAGSANGGGRGGRIRPRLEAQYRRRLAAYRGRAERRLDRRAGEFIQHARQYGRAVGRSRHDRRRAARRGDADGARPADPSAAPIRGRLSVGACRRALWGSCGTIGPRLGCSWEMRGAISSASHSRRSRW